MEPLKEITNKKPPGPWIKGMPSPNPAGRGKGVLSVAPEVKESIIKAYFTAGGHERLVRLMNTGKKADQIFLSFLRNILIPLLPKKTEMDIEHRSVTFIFGDGSQETFKSSEEEAREGVIDIEPEEEKDE